MSLASIYLTILLSAAGALRAQDTATPKPALEHVLGTVTAVDGATHTITVKEDKTGTTHTILLTGTKTLLKVEPGAKDLKSAVRITADDLQTGDRVDVRGAKAEDNPNALAARSVVLMSGRALQQAHQAQAAEWQHSTAGVVTSVDSASGKIGINVKAAEGAKSIAIQTSPQTEFTRYAPENPKTPAPSQIDQVQVGDHVRVIGDTSADGAAIAARRVYSGAFRTISGTIASIGPDGKSVTVKDLASKKPVQISLQEEAAVRKLPPMMAMMLARRFNPGYKPAEGQAARPARPTEEPGSAGSPVGANGPGGAGGPAADRGPRMGGNGAGPRRGNGDISALLERAPKIALSDLKQGDAVVVSGVATGTGNTQMLATSVIAGVEPILESAPQRQGGQNLGGDWGLGEISPPQ
ncbi:MAG TPA: DUF5666 domain-containing protein [Bryobacteraceae bacterium]